MAKLTFYYGTMNSLKTAMLLSTAFSLKQSDRKVFLISNKTDDRDNNKISSRVGLSQEPDLIVDKHTNIIIGFKEYVKENYYPDIILVDEIQFFTSEQIQELAYIVDHYAISVDVYGLKTNFQGKLFEASERLLELADSLREVKSVCTLCSSKATMNLRVDENGKAIVTGEEIQVGGNESYMPVCRKHFNKKIKEHEHEQDNKNDEED